MKKCLFILSVFFIQISFAQKAIFPRPFAFAIDDLGWNIGNNTGSIDKQGPYRIGIDRKMDKMIINVLLMLAKLLEQEFKVCLY